jgi:protein involved in polysaccharide export with SLBB domain
VSFKGNLLLEPMDEIIAFQNNKTRLLYLEKLNYRLQIQDKKGGLAHLVNISGNIRFEGIYPLTQKMSVRDLILLAGGLNEAAYLGNAQITRQDTSNPEIANIQHINVNLKDELTQKTRTLLHAKDKLAIYLTPDYKENHTIELKGEVKFPGFYEFKNDEMLSDVIKRAGGLTKQAYLPAVIFTREDLKELEKKQLRRLKNKMKADIRASQLEYANAGKGSSVKDIEGLLSSLEEVKPIGRLVINLGGILKKQLDDVRLKNGDMLLIPPYRQAISVLGEVQYSTSHLFRKSWQLDDYLERSGGLTSRADDDRIYIVKADGSVFLPNQTGWLGHQNMLLMPGDTIVVPIDTDRVKSITLWTSVTQIVYQMAIGLAALERFK